MDAIENAYVVSNLDSDFYHNMGLFLVITFCTWFVLSLLLLFVTKKKRNERPLPHHDSILVLPFAPGLPRVGSLARIRGQK